MNEQEKINPYSDGVVNPNADDDKDVLITDLANKLATGFLQTSNVLTTIASLTERFYEGNHSRFVAEKCVSIGKELGMDDDDLFELKVAASVHDIGKITFFDSALYKYQNEMTAVEFAQYVKHCELGMNILKQYDGFSGIAEIVYQHHERLDGSGFPRRLSGDKIRAAAKIISVVDYYHNVVYKKSRNKAGMISSGNLATNSLAFLEATKAKYLSALNFIHKKSNILFEKKVVEIFIDIIQTERMNLGQRVVFRIPVNKLEKDMVFAEDYYTGYGMLIASKGETVQPEMISALVRFAENGQIPMKVLVLK